MKTQHTKLLIELLVLYGLLPFVLLFGISPLIKASLILTGVIYVIYVAVVSKEITRESLYVASFKPYWKPVVSRFLVLIIITLLPMFLFNRENLFIVIRTKPMMWIGISLFYSIFSVYPQEFLYRSFFFMRYQHLFKKKYILIIVNAIIFSLAHIGFSNMLVLSITFIGGFIFALTYIKTKSLLFTSMEHALYGIWLFTLGMGEMLAFPMPE